MADDERRERSGGDVRERVHDALLVLRERLAAGKAEAGAGAQPGAPLLRLGTLDVAHQPALPSAAPRLGESLIDARGELERLAEDRGGVARPAQVARPDLGQALVLQLSRQRMRLLASPRAERRVAPALHSLGSGVVRRLAVTREQDHDPSLAEGMEALS